MIYQNERAIYVKIADRVCDDILSANIRRTNGCRVCVNWLPSTR